MGIQALRIFGKNKQDADGPAGDEVSTSTSAFEPNPRKAKAFFDHAQAVHDSTNYEYAMTLWIQGLRQHPTDMPALEHFFESGTQFMTTSAKKGPTKDQVKNFSGKGPLERYLSQLLQWGAKVNDWQAGVKAMEAAVKLDLKEPGRWIGRRALVFLVKDKKAKKDSYVKLMDLFGEVDDWECAVKCGDMAMQLDPTDGKLSARVKNFAAEATIDQSGYSKTGESGGFRENIKNLDDQRALEEGDRLVKTEDTQERLIERARADWETRPDDMGAITTYTRNLLERGTPQDEKLAYKVLMKGYESTGAYRFRERAGDIKMRVGRRNLRRIRKKLDAAPDAEKETLYKQKLDEQLKFEVTEFEDRVRNYPTDLKVRYELGRRFFELKQYDQAVAHFQEAQDSPGISTKVQHLLGQCFQFMDWGDEAESTFRRALEGHENQNDELGLTLRYDLMQAIATRAEREKNIEAAEEALKLASGIAIKQLSFRDIRERRDEIQQMVRDIRAANG